MIRRMKKIHRSIANSTMNAKLKIYCVIPAFNEEKMISMVVGKAGEYADRVVVVDDASRDATGELAARSGAVVLRHAVNRDQGAALRTGTEYALREGADIIVHFDADGQFAAVEIPDLTAPLTRGECDIVFGSRFLGKKSNLPFLKERIIFPLARLVNRIFFNIRTTDPQSGFRAFTRAAAEKITIEHDGKAHCSEILAKAAASGLRLKEVPITVTYHDYGQKFSGGLSIVKDFFLNNLTK